jgi:hypothetical protein
MSDIISRRPKRVFAFGCSFTDYNWTGWPEIIAYDLQAPLYNFGRMAAGNQYIFNAIMQADASFRFDIDDLVMVCWTNVCREDRYLQDSWDLKGNILTSPDVDVAYIDKYVDPFGYLLRDMASIHAADVLLQHRGVQYHHLQMIDLLNRQDQWNPENNLLGTAAQMHMVTSMYADVISRLNESFYQVLWNNDLDGKMRQDRLDIDESFSDGHPLPAEHLVYLQTIFEHDWRSETVQAVRNSQLALREHIKQQQQQGITWPWMDTQQIRSVSKIANSQPLRGIL